MVRQLKARQVWGRRAHLLLEQSAGEYHNAAPGQTCSTAVKGLRELHFVFEDLSELVEAGDLTLCASCSWERFLTSWAGEPLVLHADFEEQVLRAYASGYEVAARASHRGLSIEEVRWFWDEARLLLRVSEDEYSVKHVEAPVYAAIKEALRTNLAEVVQKEAIEELRHLLVSTGSGDAEKVNRLAGDPSWVLVSAEPFQAQARRTLPQLLVGTTEVKPGVFLLPRHLFELGRLSRALPAEVEVLALPGEPASEVLEAFLVLHGGEGELSTLAGALEAAQAL
jgi:hypothetical protein